MCDCSIKTYHYHTIISIISLLLWTFMPQIILLLNVYFKMLKYFCDHGTKIKQEIYQLPYKNKYW